MKKNSLKSKINLKKLNNLSKKMQNTHKKK